MKALVFNSKLSAAFLYTSFIAIIVLILEHRFTPNQWIERLILFFFEAYLVLGITFTVLKIYYKRQTNTRLIVFDIVSICFIIFCLIKQFQLQHQYHVVTEYLKAAIILKWIREMITQRINYKRSVLNPAQLFIISFLVIIAIGTILLRLPQATHSGISLLDAIFMSTSAVCVTGLTLFDLSSDFTQFGQTTILLLVQAGGLGILTFASYFAYFFKGGTTYENQLAINDMSNNSKLGEVFTTLSRILIITFSIELISAIFIFINIEKSFMPLLGDRIYFSIFHAISSFCNAGFSTVPQGMMKQEFVYNYPMQMIMICTFVMGGLGFPIIINIVRYVKYFVKRYLLWFTSGENNYRAWVMTLSSKINLITTFSLMFFGTAAFFILEFDNTLKDHDMVGKFVTAMFSATTPRSAGLNTIDFNSLHLSTLMIIILFMWIGASPASTGGGIKTSTFAIATLNFISLAKGKSKIELFRREVADISVRRAFATMTLSFIAIGAGVCLVAHFDSGYSIKDITFECVSAYCTVGLSLGITPNLSEASKIVVILLMFTGRVTMLSILIAFFKKVRPMNYEYPTDEIMIN